MLLRKPFSTGELVNRLAGCLADQRLA